MLVGGSLPPSSDAREKLAQVAELKRGHSMELDVSQCSVRVPQSRRPLTAQLFLLADGTVVSVRLLGACGASLARAFAAWPVLSDADAPSALLLQR